MTNTPFTALDQFRDIESVNWAAEAAARGVPHERIMWALRIKSRDNARTPVAWDDSANAGFTTGRPWIDLNPNYPEVNAAAAVADPDSVFHHYRKLIELRHTLPVVVHGDYRLLLPGHEQIFAYVRALDDQRLLVMANMSGEPAEVDLGADAALADGELLLAAGGAGTGTLAPWESRVIRTG